MLSNIGYIVVMLPVDSDASQTLVLCLFLGISDGPNVSALTNGLDTPEERYTKLKKVWGFHFIP